MSLSGTLRRILVATPLYPPELGGPATYSHILSQELPALGVEVVLVKFRSVRRYPKVVRHFFYFLAILWRGRNVDMILALDPVSTGFPAFLAAHILRKPFVVKVVGDYAWEQGTQHFGVTETLDEFIGLRPSSWRVPVRLSLLKKIERIVARGAVQVIVPSEYLRRIILAWQVPSERIAVIQNAIRTEAAGVVPEAVLALSRPRIVSVGRLVPWKGMVGVIAAVGLVQREMPVSLAIVGDGPELAMLTRHARAELKERAVLTGSLSHADTLAVLKDADAVVLNSTYEGLSHLLIEALTMGTAIIATDVGGNAELILDGGNGLLVPSGDTAELARTITKVLRDPVLTGKLRTGALRAGKSYLPVAMAEKTVALLSSLT